MEKPKIDPYGYTQEQRKIILAKRDMLWSKGFEHYCQNEQPRIKADLDMARKALAHYKALEGPHFHNSPFRDIVDSLTGLITALTHYDNQMCNPASAFSTNASAQSKQMYYYLKKMGLVA